MEILLTLNGEQTDPHTLEEVQALLASGEATMEDYAWWDGCEDWVTIADIPGISEGGPEAEATEEPVEEEPAGEATADIYVFPEGAEDWDGPHTLAHIQEMVANAEATETDFAAYDGSAEGSTVADIPGFADAATAAQEEPAEEELVEEEPAVPAKKMGMKKGGLKKGGLAKRGASGFGAKKSAGGAIKKGAAKSAAKKGAAKSAAKKASAKKDKEAAVEEDAPKTGKGLRVTTGVLLILGTISNLFIGSCSTFLGSMGEKGAELANDAGTAIVDSANDVDNGSTEDDDNKEEAKKKIKEGTDKLAAKSGHAKAHGFGLLGAAMFCLLGCIFAFMGKVGIMLLISGIVIALIGVWGIAASFMVGIFFIGTGVWNLASGVLAVIASKHCK